MLLIRTVFVPLIALSLLYLVTGDDSVAIRRRDLETLHRAVEWRLREDISFSRSGICSSGNRSRVQTCTDTKLANSVHALRNASCFCDDACHAYHDCCIDRVLPEDVFARKWSCRVVVGQYRFHVYVIQTCPAEWTDADVRRLCEKESSELEEAGERFTHVQDVPVKSEKTGLFYRNVFCALCDGVRDVVKWKSYFHCTVNSSSRAFKQDELDFSSAVYNTRTQSFKRVKIVDTLNSCRLLIEDFETFNSLSQHGARFCKPVIDTCLPSSDDASSRHCGAYTSFVYESTVQLRKRKVYKNFHCALCNNASVGSLKCLDPLHPIVYQGEPTEVPATLSFLFDFNFDGGGNQIGFVTPCKLRNGKIWDPVFKRCTDFICGKFFERKDSVCVPIVDEPVAGALNDTCPKVIIKKGEFHIYDNESVFINSTATLLSPSEYEVTEIDGKEIMSILVCAGEGSYLMHLSKVQYYLSEITLSLSIICLVLHLFVYSVLKELRNCPGKILMSLSTCLLCGHVFLLIGPHIRGNYWMCYVCGVLMHFGYLSSFLWMSVMAFDIYRTFSATQSRNMAHSRTFMKYSLCCWTIAFFITTTSVLFDTFISEDNEFRPKYGNPICWFNQRKGVLVFFILPIFALLIKNAVLFTMSAFKINRISQQTKMVGNFSDRVRYFLYIKLSIVFGLTWVLGFLAGVLQADFLWYLFIILNGLQGVFIFISFTVKRKILNKLLVKFRVRSDKYRFSKDSSALKRTMYSSLSNLSSLQTTLTAHLPALEDNPDILKSVTKINPDSLIKDSKLR